jgi:hypothetical protein
VDVPPAAVGPRRIEARRGAARRGGRLARTRLSGSARCCAGRVDETVAADRVARGNETYRAAHHVVRAVRRPRRRDGSGRRGQPSPQRRALRPHRHVVPRLARQPHAGITKTQAKGGRSSPSTPSTWATACCCRRLTRRHSTASPRSRPTASTSCRHRTATRWVMRRAARPASWRRRASTTSTAGDGFGAVRSAAKAVAAWSDAFSGDRFDATLDVFAVPGVGIETRCDHFRGDRRRAGPSTEATAASCGRVPVGGRWRVRDCRER